MSIPVLIRLTLRELSSKATMYVLAGISTVVLIGTALAVSVSTTPEGSILSMFGQQASPVLPADQIATFVRQMQAGLAGGLFTGIMLFGVFATAGIIPEMLERGTVDLYLSKPVGRAELLLGKYSGGVVAIGLNIIYFLAGAWLVSGLRTGIWDTTLVTASLVMLFMFAVLFTLVVFAGVWTRSTATTIILVYLFLFIIEGPLLHSREQTLYLISENVVYRTALDGLYYLFPQISGMQAGGRDLILGLEVDWKPFLQSALSGGAFLAGAAVLFKRRDF